MAPDEQKNRVGASVAPRGAGFAALRQPFVFLPLLVLCAFGVFAALEARQQEDGSHTADNGAETATESAGESESPEQVAADTTATDTTATTTTSSTSTSTTGAPGSLESSFAPVSEAEFAATLQHLQDADVLERFENAPDFDRAEYIGDVWPDLDGDCQSVRQEVLIEESVETVLDAEGCDVELGLWIDPYDGVAHNDPVDVSVDHVVPLGHAHLAGAWEWDAEIKAAFAADVSFPASLTVVGAAIDADKGEQDPTRWRPPLEDAWCRYAVDWTAVKARWDLSFVDAEVSALAEMLSTCDVEGTLVGSPPADPEEPAAPEEPAEPDPEQPVEPEEPAEAEPTAEPEPEQPAEPEPSAEGAADIAISWCRVITEDVQLQNVGADEVTLSGWVLHDAGREHEADLRTVTLAPGELVVLLSGEDTSDSAGVVRWSSVNVWDNGGDTATLRNSAGEVVATAACDLQSG